MANGHFIGLLLPVADDAKQFVRQFLIILVAATAVGVINDRLARSGRFGQGRGLANRQSATALSPER